MYKTINYPWAGH